VHSRYLRSKPSVVGQSDEVGHFVQRHLVVVDPPVALPHAAVDSVLPNAAGQVNLPLDRVGVQHRRDDQLVVDRELVVDALGSLVQGLQHPERANERHAVVQRVVHRLGQQRIHQGLPQIEQRLCNFLDLRVVSITHRIPKLDFVNHFFAFLNADNCENFGSK
jgi:hypothetical protein